MSSPESPTTSRLARIIASPLLVAVITAAVTGLLTHHFTEKRVRAEAARAAVQRDTEAMQKAHDEVSRILDTRLWRTRRLLQWSGRGGTRGEYLEALTAYRQSVDDWNTNLNHELTLVEQYFGADARDELENGIGKAFQTLNAAMSVEEKTPIRELNGQVNALNDMVAHFNRRLLAKIKERRASIPNCGSLTTSFRDRLTDESG